MEGANQFWRLRLAELIKAEQQPQSNSKVLSIPATEQQILFDHENRLRAIEGVPLLSQEDFAQKAKR